MADRYGRYSDDELRRFATRDLHAERCAELEIENRKQREAHTRLEEAAQAVVEQWGEYGPANEADWDDWQAAMTEFAEFTRAALPGSPTGEEAGSK